MKAIIKLHAEIEIDRVDFSDEQPATNEVIENYLREAIVDVLEYSEEEIKNLSIEVIE